MAAASTCAAHGAARDIHADAFERQVIPRPGVGFPIDVALLESDRQAVSNGITTLYHGVTWSWELGLRGADNARAMLNEIEALRPQLGADTRCHLRYETFNLDAEAEVTGWLDDRRIGMLGFNDHMPGENTPPRTRKVAEMAARAGLSREDFLALVERLRTRADEVPGSISRLAAAANASDVALLSHDDMSPEQRRWFRALDCRLAEFPTTLKTAEDATRAGDDVVMGAPQCGSRWQPYRLDRRRRHDRARVLHDSRLGLLLSRAIARRVSACG